MLTQRDSRRMSRDHTDAAEIMPDMQDSSLVSMNDAPSDDAGSNHDDNPESNRNNHNSPYYHRIQKYLEKCAELDEDEKFKHECEKYELRDGILYNARTGRCVILDLEFMKETLEFGHNDIQHYGKRATSKAVVQRFDVTKDLSMEGRKVLDGCIPC